MRSTILMLVFYVLIGNLYAQNNINGYKYIIVPKKFDFQKTADKYQLNSLTKFLFNKEGFTTLFEGDKMPQDLFDNPCLGLKANALNTSGMLSTKLTIELVDCRNTHVFTSLEGKSKIKDFKGAYHEALRKAFQSVKDLNYRYDASLTTTISSQDATVNEEATIPLVEEETLEAEVTYPKKETIVVEDKEAIKEVVVSAVEEKISEVNAKPVANEQTTENILYAQTKSFGYQLVDSTPSVVYVLQKSSMKDVYILKNKSGIVYKQNEKWMAEYYENDVLHQKELNIKF